MKFLFFASGSYIGGMEMVTLSLMKELIAQGHECYAIVSGWNDGLYPAKLCEARIPHRSIKLGRIYLSKPIWMLDGLVNFPAAARTLHTVIREFDPHVVVIASVEFALTVLQVLPRDIPIVLHVHDIPNKHYSSWAGRYVLTRTAGVIAVSDFIKDHLTAIIGEKVSIRTVHNGVPTFENVCWQSAHKMRVGIVGQLIPRKKHDVLMDAVKMLPKSVRDQIEICIYGSDATEFAMQIKQRIDTLGLLHCVSWMGFVPYQAGIYGNLDLVAAPALGEPFGTTVLEAGAFGLPVVAARSGGFPEMVVEGKTGLLINPSDPEDLACALEQLMTRKVRETLGTGAQQHIRTHFSEEAMARKFVNAMENFELVP